MRQVCANGFGLFRVIPDEQLHLSEPCHASNGLPLALRVLGKERADRVGTGSV
jgi:hypothetical protein